jgi:hypothetical protein
VWHVSLGALRLHPDAHTNPNVAFAEHCARLCSRRRLFHMAQWIRVFWTLGSPIDLTDRIFYVFVPPLGNLLVVISAVTLFVHWPLSAELLAGALIVLLLAGIRNTRDMTVWIVTRSPTRG